MISNDPKNLEQAIQNLERETRKESDKLHTDQKEMSDLIAEDNILRQEIPQLELKIKASKEKLRTNEVKIQKFKADISKMQNEQSKAHAQLEKVKHDYTESLHKSGVKGVKLY